MILRIVSGIIESATPSDISRLFIDGRELALPPGAVLLPGFVDTHCHLMGAGEMADRVQLHGLDTAQLCAEAVAARTAGTPTGEWILGFGYNEEEWSDRRAAHRSLLDAVVPDHPVALFRIDTHAAWLNTPALRAAGIEPHEIHGGSIDVGEDGEMTGILIDEAVNLVRRAIPKPSVEQQRRWMAHGVAECLRYGLTEVHDMNVEPERIEAMTRSAEAGEMRIRCQAFLQAQEDQWRAVTGPMRLGANVDIVGVKYFADGALGSRGALLIEPYSDAPHTCGLELMGAAELISRAVEPIERGFAVATHAIGDGANRAVLDAYTALRARYPDALLRIEHAQIVHPGDVPRFVELGVIAAMQPTHCTSDASMAEARLGPERCEYAYGWRNLHELGVPIIGGSDFPIESADPLAGIRAFHFREPRPGAGPWHPEQSLSRADALATYTSAAPRGIPGGTRRGHLAAGHDADVVVLSADPFDDRDAIVLRTIVAGVVEYEAD